MALAEFVRLTLETCRLVPNRFIIPTPDGISPYLERIVLKRGDDGSGTYLHLIWDSDKDRDPHDHPWDFESLIVYGGYQERRPMMKDGLIIGYQDHTYNQYQWNNKKAEDLHQLTLLTVPTVTLVTHGPIRRRWGFQTESGWVDHKPYIEAKTGRAYESVD